MKPLEGIQARNFPQKTWLKKLKRDEMWNNKWNLFFLILSDIFK